MLSSEEIVNMLPLEDLFTDYDIADRLITSLEYFLEREMDNSGHDYWSELSQIQRAHIELISQKNQELNAKVDELLIRDDIVNV